MSTLPTRTLGRTGLEVTELGFGAMELRGPPKGRELPEEEAAKVLNSVLDAGIDLIDTSIDYGMAEERIGRHISHRREQFFLASKCGCPVERGDGGGSTSHDYGRDNVTAGVEQSLRRLRTDYLDLVQVHVSPSKATLEEEDTVATLQDLQRQGKVRFLGMSGTLPHLPDHIAMGVFDAFQIPYSAVQREHERLITHAARAGAGVIVRGGMGKGAPTGHGRLPSRHRHLAEAWERVELDDLLETMPSTEFMLRFAISHPDITTVIVGTLDPSHLAANVEAATKGPLPPDVYAETRRRLDMAGVHP